MKYNALYLLLWFYGLCVVAEPLVQINGNSIVFRNTGVTKTVKIVFTADLHLHETGGWHNTDRQHHD